MSKRGHRHRQRQRERRRGRQRGTDIDYRDRYETAYIKSDRQREMK